MKRFAWAALAVMAVVAGAVIWIGARTANAVTVSPVSAPIAQTLVFSGRVATPSKVELGATITGRVAEVRANKGDVARAGDPLLRLESDEIAAQLAQARAARQAAVARLDGQRELAVPTSEASLAQAEANLEAARREASRTRELFVKGFVSQARVDETQRALEVAQAQARAAHAAARAQRGGGTETAQMRLRLRETQAAESLATARLAQTRIVAPADGRVIDRLVEPGQIVQPGRGLLVFAIAGATQLVAQADEKFLAQLAPRQPVTVVADAFPGQPFAASVSAIAPGVDAQRGTIEVKALVAEPPSFLREDMTLTMQVLVGRKERALTVPASAVIGAGRDASLRVVEDGRVRERAVRTGLRTLQVVEIVEGLDARAAVLIDPLSIEPGVRARALTADGPALDKAANRAAAGGVDVGQALGAR